MAIFTRNNNVNVANPLNMSHPLNRGMFARWLVLPGLSGGMYWHNIATVPTLLPSHNHGLRDNGGSDHGHDPYFSGTNRPGAFGHVVCQGVSTPIGFINCGDVASGGSEYSMGLWLNIQTHLNSNDTILSQEVNTNDFSFLIDAATHVPRMYQNPGNLSGTTVLTAFTWWHLVVTWTPALSGLLSIYVNGLLDANGTGYTSRNTGTSVPFLIGADPTFGRQLAGFVDDAFYMKRCMGAKEVRDFYLNSQQSYPGTINRVGPQVLTSSSNSVKFRRTLSQFGARVGSRQIQGT